MTDETSAAISDRDEIIATARDLDAATMDAETCTAGPGRYEGASDLELLVACDVIAMHGFADATAGSVEYGRYGARIGRYVVWTDDRGFVSLETFETASGAQDALDAEDTAQEQDDSELPPISSVWSSYGHRFMSTDSEDDEVCLMCGAMYRLQRTTDDPTRGEYIAHDGSEPLPCSGRTDLNHGYPGEVEEPSAAEEIRCNCLFCDS